MMPPGDTYQEVPPAVSWTAVGLARNPVKLEKAVISTALYASYKERQRLGQMPAFSFSDRSRSKAYQSIIRALVAMPDGYSTEELAKASGVSAALIVELQADLPMLSLKEMLKLLMAQRVSDSIRDGLDPLPWAQALTAMSSDLFVIPEQQKNPFVNLADVDLAGDLSPAYLINRYIEEDSLVVIFGPSGGGKTFVTLDLALCVATGTDWNGQPVKQGVVVYLCGEGHAGFRRRVRAWLQQHGLKIPDTFILSRYAVAFDESARTTVTAAAQAASERAGVPVRLFVVDTLDRHIDGDENKTPDMGRFIKVADSFKLSFPGSVVLIVHHTGKADYATGRGATNLKAAADVEFRCMNYQLDFSKMKDAETPDPVPFKLVPVQIGLTDEGEPVTSCVPEYGCQPARAAADTGVKLPRYEQQALDALITVCAAENRPNHGKQYMAAVDAWREEFYRLRLIEEPEEKQNSLKTQFQRARFGTDKGGGLVEKGVVHVAGLDAVLLRIADSEKVKSAVFDTSGTRYTAGTQAVHVPADEYGTQRLHIPL